LAERPFYKEIREYQIKDRERPLGIATLARRMMGAAAIMAMMTDRMTILTVEPARNAGKRGLDKADPEAGPLAPHVSAQTDLEEEFTIPWGGYEITAVQCLGIEALVLGRLDYTQRDMDILVPIDLALA